MAETRGKLCIIRRKRFAHYLQITAAKIRNEQNIVTFFCHLLGEGATLPNKVRQVYNNYVHHRSPAV
jgi:hypothetical protein